MKRVSLFAVLALVVFAVPASAALDPGKAGVDVRADAREHPPAFCSKGASLGTNARNLCPLVDDGLDCPALADTCRAAAAAASASVTASASDHREDEPARSGGSGLDAFGYVAFWLLVAVLAIALGTSAASAIIRARRERAALGSLDTDAPLAADRREDRGPGAPRDLLGEARTREDAGDLEGAIYMYLDAALRALEQRGAIRMASERTNGEYVRACRERDARDALRQIVATVESVKFGGVTPTGEHVETARKRATKLVKGVAAAVAVVLALSARDGSAREATPAADPLGTALLTTALEHQGIAVGSPPTRLARLPLPDPSEKAPPALLVDLSRVHPNADARAHLVTWVRAGGTLILLGHPELWPSDLGVATVPGSSRVVTASKSGSTEMYFGAVATPTGFWTKAGVEAPLASTGDELTYATWWQWDRGAVIGVASDEVFVDVGIAHRENAEIALTILAPVKSRSLWIASDADGVEGPSSPLDSLANAGFGLGLAHAAIAALLLFAAFGVRLARAKPMPPPVRRAFAEHVEATGRLYARVGVANHALTAYARMFDDRLHESLPRGTDAAAYVAHRTGRSVEECAKLLDRTSDAKLPPFDALALLARLVDVHETLFHRPARRNP